MTKYFRHLVYISLIAAIFFCATQIRALESVTDKTAQEWHDEGAKQLTLEQFEEAIYSFTRCLVLNNENVDCLIKRGLANSKSNKYLAALEDLEKAVELAPRNAEAQYHRGKLEIGFDAEIPYYTKAIALDPDYTAAYFERGLAYSFTDRVNALADFNKTIELDPEYTEAYILRGNIYQLSKKPDLALADYSSAIRIEPNARTYYIRGLTYFDFGKYTQAIEDFNKSAEFDANYYWTFKKRGDAYRKLGKLKLANADEAKAAKIGRPQ